MPMPPRLTIIGDLERPDHFHLPADARCYFWGEYTPYEHTNGKKWDYSPTNQLIANFKKRMDRRGQLDWQYKTQAIQRVAQQFGRGWKWDVLTEEHHVALVPVPPSKARQDAMYDPRMMEVLQGIQRVAGRELDIRDCLSFSGKYAASHEAEDRPTPDQLFDELIFDGGQGGRGGEPGLIFLFDDMLTTGAHFVAVSRKLHEHYPGVPVIGQFIARRIIPNPFDDF